MHKCVWSGNKYMFNWCHETLCDIRACVTQVAVIQAWLSQSSVCHKEVAVILEWLSQESKCHKEASGRTLTINVVLKIICHKRVAVINRRLS